MGRSRSTISREIKRNSGGRGYGHALGIEHSSDGRDFMAPSLQPGERRLPTADELSLMSKLVAALKSEKTFDTVATVTNPGLPQPLPRPYGPNLPIGGGMAFLAFGYLRRNDYGGWSLNMGGGQNILAPAPLGTRKMGSGLTFIYFLGL